MNFKTYASLRAVVLFLTFPIWFPGMIVLWCLLAPVVYAAEAWGGWWKSVRNDFDNRKDPL